MIKIVKMPISSYENMHKEYLENELDRMRRTQTPSIDREITIMVNCLDEPQHQIAAATDRALIYQSFMRDICKTHRISEQVFKVRYEHLMKSQGRSDFFQFG